MSQLLFMTAKNRHKLSVENHCDGFRGSQYLNLRRLIIVIIRKRYKSCYPSQLIKCLMT